MQKTSMNTEVYVRGDDPIYHLDPKCGASRPRDGSDSIGTCRAGQAYQSCLNPCLSCARELAETLKATLGVIPSGERKRRSRPQLRPAPIVATTSKGRLRIATDHHHDTDAANGLYGAPTSADDIRFGNASRLGWGVAAFGQNHDEFLGERTDDDNDWRGGGNYLD